MELREEDVEKYAQLYDKAYKKGHHDGNLGLPNTNLYSLGSQEYHAYEQGYLTGHMHYMTMQEEDYIIEEVFVCEDKPKSR